MGKGKNWKCRTNAVRRKRKEKSRRFFEHIVKHPDYYNAENPIPYRILSMIIIFRLLWLQSIKGKVR